MALINFIRGRRRARLSHKHTRREFWRAHTLMYSLLFALLLLLQLGWESERVCKWELQRPTCISCTLSAATREQKTPTEPWMKNINLIFSFSCDKQTFGRAAETLWKRGEPKFKSGAVQHKNAQIWISNFHAGQKETEAGRDGNSIKWVSCLSHSHIILICECDI